MHQKLDFLRDCMSGFDAVPIDQFNLAWCTKCVNKECSRAQAGQLFNIRAETWKEKLFTDVKRANEKDPNFAHIFSKPFQLVNADPLTIQSIPAFPQPAPEVQPIPAPEPAPMNFKTEEKPVELKEEILEVVPEIKSVPEPIQIAQPVQPQIIQNLAIPFNTPFSQPVMIKGKATPNETVIESGGTFTFEDE